MSKAEDEKRRHEEAIASATGLRVLSAIAAAVPVRLMKRDLLFVVERILPMVEDRRLEIVARNRGIKKAKDGDSITKLLSAYLRKAEEGEPATRQALFCPSFPSSSGPAMQALWRNNGASIGSQRERSQ